jgi:hypothetical protein
MFDKRRPVGIGVELAQGPPSNTPPRSQLRVSFKLGGSPAAG